MSKDVEGRPAERALLAAIRATLPQLKALFDNCMSEGTYEDGVYRFYHQSFKVYRLQQTTTEIVTALRKLAPQEPLNEWFTRIIWQGTGKRFEGAPNRRCLEETRAIIEAFFHARFFLEMAIRYGQELEAPPSVLPSGWAALLYLYNLR